MPIFRSRKFTFFPFLILFKRIESIDMTPCVISFLVYEIKAKSLSLHTCPMKSPHALTLPFVLYICSLSLSAAFRYLTFIFSLFPVK